MELGFLEEVNVRELWKHEQYDFSNWLAKEKSMELLGDENHGNILLTFGAHFWLHGQSLLLPRKSLFLIVYHRKGRNEITNYELYSVQSLPTSN